MPLTPQELFAKVKAIESQLCVKQEGKSVLVTFESITRDMRMYVRMPNEVWLHFLQRQIETLPADTPVYASPFPADPDYAGDAEHLPVLPPPDASQEETKPLPTPGAVEPGSQQLPSAGHE
jgi:hypothetical protein